MISGSQLSQYSAGSLSASYSLTSPSSFSTCFLEQFRPSRLPFSVSLRLNWVDFPPISTCHPWSIGVTGERSTSFLRSNSQDLEISGLSSGRANSMIGNPSRGMQKRHFRCWQVGGAFTSRRPPPSTNSGVSCVCRSMYASALVVIPRTHVCSMMGRRLLSLASKSSTFTPVPIPLHARPLIFVSCDWGLIRARLLDLRLPLAGSVASFGPVR